MTKPTPRILFVADLNEYSKGFARRRVLGELPFQVTELTHTRISGAGTGHPAFSLRYRIAYKLGFHLDTERVNRRIRQSVRLVDPDVLWIEKGTMIRAATLRKVRRDHPNCAIVSYSDDDMFLPHNRSRAYIAGLRFYDCVFTTKAHNTNRADLDSLGARRVVLVDKAFDPHQHRPLQLNGVDHAELDCDVGFVGTYEKYRGESLLFLARRGITVRVWGNGWEAMRSSHSNLIVERKAVVNTLADLRYTKCVCATRINLGYLRKLNRDLHTDRSVEIPACGGFLLAERSADHQRLFAEDWEAVYFSSDEELLAKVRYYLAHESERAAIAAAGLRRCHDSGYSEVDRMTRIISTALCRDRAGP